LYPLLLWHNNAVCRVSHKRKAADPLCGFVFQVIHDQAPKILLAKPANPPCCAGWPLLPDM
jgi:hypothetical protein